MSKDKKDEAPRTEEERQAQRDAARKFVEALFPGAVAALRNMKPAVQKAPTWPRTCKNPLCLTNHSHAYEKQHATLALNQTVTKLEFAIFAESEDEMNQIIEEAIVEFANGALIRTRNRTALCELMKKNAVEANPQVLHDPQAPPEEQWVKEMNK